MIIISPIARFILFVLGWSDPNTLKWIFMKDDIKTVGIYLHTSQVDFWIMLLYMLGYDYIRKRLYVLVKPQPFENKIVRYILTKLHCIPSSRIEDSGTGKTAVIVDRLKELKSYIFLISPKGNTRNTEWRTGWWYIAKESGSTISIFTLDYRVKNIVYREVDMSSNDMGDVKRDIISKLKNTYPLYPRNSELHTNDTISYGWYEDWKMIAFFTIISYIIYYIFGYFSLILYLSDINIIEIFYGMIVKKLILPTNLSIITELLISLPYIFMVSRLNILS